MSHALDEFDLRIIQQLQIDPRISITALAEKIELSRPTAMIRLKRLLDEKLMIIKGGLSLREYGFKVAHVGLEVRTDKSRNETETFLRKCPRVLAIYRTPNKANIHANVWGENDQTLNSTIESFRDQQNVDIVYTYNLGTPIHGDIPIRVEAKSDVTPCNRTCSECRSFLNEWCRGCPSSSDYKSLFLTN